MKFLLNTILFLCLTQYAAAFVLWPFDPAIKRSTEEPKHVGGGGESLICKIDQVFLACRALGAVATSFCASYLHISTSTSVAYTTVPTVTTVPFTLTSTITTTTTTTTTDVSSTSTTTTTTTTEEVTLAPKRRAVKPAAVPIPPLLGKFAASELSSACSCLSIKFPATTSTSTVPTVVIATSTGFATTISTSTTVYTTSTSTILVAVSTSTVVDSSVTCALPGKFCNMNADCCFDGICASGSCIV